MKLGIMNNPAVSVYDEAEFCGRGGFDFLDLTIEGPKAADIDVPRLKSILDRYSLGVVGHTDPCLPWAYPVSGIRQACLKELERCARVFSGLGAGVMNIHPCYFSPPAMRKDLLSFNIEALPPVARMAADHGLTLVLENFQAPFDRVSAFKTILAAVPGLRLHLDFGHTHFGHDDSLLFCGELGALIGHVHFSDNRSRSDDHMPLGVGTIAWREAVGALKSTGYDGTISLEVFCGDPDMRFRYLDLSRRFVSDLWKIER